jgi:hypothetical protein
MAGRHETRESTRGAPTRHFGPSHMQLRQYTGRSDSTQLDCEGGRQRRRTPRAARNGAAAYRSAPGGAGRLTGVSGGARRGRGKRYTYRTIHWCLNPDFPNLALRCQCLDYNLHPSQDGPIPHTPVLGHGRNTLPLIGAKLLRGLTVWSEISVCHFFAK